ncbi:Astacin-like metalloprotease toxin 1 [Araneus ventricosus]|uniref:Metalloendopeptidase n=1 Tax=Araneus ventricosus TaxID=182803 RepID=A0A4Y2FF66_ARAVE|nr:Astacin-like metalloprotease toxin 1 [Araneus ventricosus]
MKATVIVILAITVTSWANTVRRRDPMMNPGLFEGDMLNEKPSNDRSAVPLDSQRWPGAEIPYVIDKYFTSTATEALKAGMEHISSKTCIKFVPRTNERDYIKVFFGSGCYAHWGRIGGEQSVSLGLGCHDIGTVVHELLHAVGFEHEHNRSDRDDYLTIHWENIDVGFEDSFEPLMPHEERLLTDFDFDSVMLYGSLAFSKDPDLKTMEALDGRFMPEVYHKTGLSEDDIKRVNMLYDC